MFSFVSNNLYYLLGKYRTSLIDFLFTYVIKIIEILILYGTTFLIIFIFYLLMLFDFG